MSLNPKNMANQRLKHIVFLRRLSKSSKWGGLEKVMMEWFERIDYGACRVTLGVSPGGKELFQKRFAEKKFPVEIVEFSSDFTGGTGKLFREMYKFLVPLAPYSVIFIQGDFSDFQLGDVLAGFLISGNRVYMNENLSPPAPLNKVSTYHLGVFRGIGLWWYAQRFINNSRALFSRKILVLSHEIKDQLSKQWGYPPQKIVVAYHGLDLKTYAVWPQKRLESRRKLNIPEKDFVFILPARLVKEKRIDRAIEAFDQLAKEHDHLWLLIMGEGNLSQELKHLAGQKASRDRIIFLGYQENVVDYLSAADCYVNSSEVEGLCIALLEAMACGLICVATYCAGPTELLQNSQAGFLVGKNAEGVLEGMQKSLTLNPAERAKLIQRGIHFIRQNFELNRLVKNTLTYLQVPNKFNDAL